MGTTTTDTHPLQRRNHMTDYQNHAQGSSLHPGDNQLHPLQCGTTWPRIPTSYPPVNDPYAVPYGAMSLTKSPRNTRYSLSTSSGTVSIIPATGSLSITARCFRTRLVLQYFRSQRPLRN